MHAHAFRHTFATVACQAGSNLERLRAAMGHADYAVLLRYVRLSSELDLGSLAEWPSFIEAAGGHSSESAATGRPWTRS
ncbi:MAG TPA: tyrosine-type recombinase/integrase [Candidatus Dormibacteraeota bacterium]|nr:tyrosine-type recombinase/integrase [Candidatus Dormibacteraeota bacterium]